MDIDMSATRQQMLETAEHLNQQMTDGIPFTWETLEQALTSVTEQDDKGIHGWICYFAAFYQLTTGNQEGCLHFLDERQVSSGNGSGASCSQSVQYDRYCGTYAEQPVAGHGTVR